MLQHILVPLDGSRQAELALPLAASLARQTAGTISLLRAVPHEPEHDTSNYSRAEVLAKEVHKRLLQEARNYLEEIARSDALATIPTDTHVLSEAPAHAILDYAHAEQVDLIIISNRGWTSSQHWTPSSITQKVVRASMVPLLVLSGEQELSSLLHPEKAQPVRVLVALDGSPAAEATLGLAIEFVTLLNPPPAARELHLLRVVKPLRESDEHWYLAYGIDLKAWYRDEAERYLQTVKHQLLHTMAPESHLTVTCSVVEDVDVATAIMNSAETGDCVPRNSYDLIVLAAHGRGKSQRWLLGNIAERLLEGSKLPLLIVRPAVLTNTAPAEKAQAMDVRGKTTRH
jgi:nucleotide-binding universal stress UspA family protein